MDSEAIRWAEFCDTELEREFTLHERSARLGFIRSILLFGGAIFVAYMVTNPLSFGRETVVGYTQAATIVLATLAVYYAATYFRAFLEKTWIDPLVYGASAAALGLILKVLASESELTGFSEILLVGVNYAILIVAGCLLFVAATREFVAWLAILLAVAVSWIFLLDGSLVEKMFALGSLLSFSMFAVIASVEIGTWARRTYLAQRQLAEEKAKSEEMLYNVLPRQVAERIRDGEVVADAYSDISVIFADVVNFSQLSKRLTARHVVDVLNRFFNAADKATDKHGVEKVKTIGDAYLAVAGGTASEGSGAQEALDFALDLLEALRELSREEDLDLQMRIGIHTGPVVGGVVGTSRLAYDYWGDTVNIASRVESVAPHNGLAVSAATYFQLKDRWHFGEGETVTLKGVGDIEVYKMKTDNQVW